MFFYFIIKQKSNTPFNILKLYKEWLNVKWHACLNKHNTPCFKSFSHLLSIHVSFHYFLMTIPFIKKNKYIFILRYEHLKYIN